jgi:hypothetical protein
MVSEVALLCISFWLIGRVAGPGGGARLMIPRYQCLSLEKGKLKGRGSVPISYFPHTMQDVTSEEQEAAYITTPFQDESQSKSLPRFYQPVLAGLISALIFKHP